MDRILKSSGQNPGPDNVSLARTLYQGFEHFLQEFREGRGILKLPPLQGRMPEPVRPDHHHVHLAEEGDPADHSTPSRYHYYHEVFLQLSGTTVFIMPGGRVRLNPGECLLMPARLPHAEAVDESQGAFANLVVWFLPPQVNVHLAGLDSRGLPQEHYLESFGVPEVLRLQALLEDAVGLAAEGLPDAELGIRSLFTAFLVRVSHLLVSPGKSKGSARVAQARALVARQFADPTLNVQALARRLACSPDHLSHQFHRETGERLTSHLNNIRLDQAQRLLADPDKTDLTIAEIASHSGFADPKYFTRLFRHATGLTPTDYRDGKRA